MSAIITMTSVAVALSVAGVSAAALVSESINDEKYGCNLENIEPAKTCFADKVLLVKTLEEHGFLVEEADYSIVVRTNAGSIRFFQKEGDGAFWALPFDLKSEEEIEKYRDEITEEYLMNVQKKNYMLIKEQLQKSSNMQLESEVVLEDDTILLTIQV